MPYIKNFEGGGVLGTPNPEGPERHLDAARQKLPRDNFCRSVAARQLPSPRGQFWKRKNCPLLWGRGNLGEAFWEAISVRVIARLKNCRETPWGVNFWLARHQDASQGPLGNSLCCISSRALFAPEPLACESRIEIRAACYRIENRGNPENSWGGCWEECRENSGCWRECWLGCCSSFLSKESPPRQHTLQHPEFSQHSPQHPPQLFSGFPRFSIL